MLTHRKLVLLTQTKTMTIEFMLSNNYLFSARNCIPCNRQMNLINKEIKSTFRCPKCRNEVSIFTNHLFYNTNLEINILIDLLYFWSMDLMQVSIREQIESRSRQTVTNWYKKLQEFCYYHERVNSQRKIGGVGMVVQIDESLFSKRKYNVGRLVRKVWVVGGICYETNETFFVETLFRTKEVLNNIIQENVVPGTIIYTDEWAGYNDLNNLGYVHSTVNHSVNYVDPETGVNTQLIEATWSVAKRWLRRRGISNRCDLFLYFIEYCFKRKYKNNVFEVIMLAAKNYYDLLNY